MGNVPSGKIRNVALVGHGGSGKTTLAEALLVTTGVINRAGRTEDGTTVCDFEPEEVKRHISVSLAVAPVPLGDFRINIIDTPGYADFAAEMEAALSVADLAVVVVSAVEGVEVQTEAAWRAAAALGLPRLVFINKLDRERADFERTLDQLRQMFGAGIAPLELPIGQEASFSGSGRPAHRHRHHIRHREPRDRARYPTRCQRWSTGFTTPSSKGSSSPTTT